MTQLLDLRAIVQIIGPRSAEGAAERDHDDIFVAKHYEVLKSTKYSRRLFPPTLAAAACATAPCASSCAS